MKKIVLLTSILFIMLGMTSCKKLLGLDAESLLTREPWIGVKMEIYVNGSLNEILTANNDVLIFYKKPKTYIGFHNNIESDKGTWNYNKKNKKLTLDSENIGAYVYDMIKLDKKNLIFSIKLMDDDGTLGLYKIYYKRD